MLQGASPLNALSDYDYGLRRWDLDYWRPYVQDICARHQLSDCGDVELGGGTNIVVIVDGRYVLKLYSPFAGTIDGFLGELDTYALARQPSVPAPALVAHGFLLSEAEPWRWPYLITRLVAGRTYDVNRTQVTFEDKVRQAEFLARALRALHDLPVDLCRHLRPTWDAFAGFLARQRTVCVDNQARWNTVPEHLHAQIDRYLPPVDSLFDAALPPRLLHCDVVGDHVLGRFEYDRWRPTCLIDFGDAKMGDRLFDLPTVHLELFRCDKRLLRVFLEHYGLPHSAHERFAQRCMSYTLLHEFRIARPAYPGLPDTVETLEELATLVWDLDAPGLPGSEP